MAKALRKVRVAKAIRTLRNELRTAIAATNKQAAKRLTQGDYAAAQEMIEAAKTVAAFDREVVALQSRWKGLHLGGSARRGKKDATPLWEYYQPILQALVALGGTATQQGIEKQLEGSAGSWLKEADLVANVRGIPRWKNLVRQARKHMLSEGFLENVHGREWRISRKGEQAAKAPRGEKRDPAQCRSPSLRN